MQRFTIGFQLSTTDCFGSPKTCTLSNLWNTRVLDDDVRHVCDTCFDKGKTESCLVKAPAMRASESVLVVSELLCTGVQANTERHTKERNARNVLMLGIQTTELSLRPKPAFQCVASVSEHRSQRTGLPSSSSLQA